MSGPTFTGAYRASPVTGQTTTVDSRATLWRATVPQVPLPAGKPPSAACQPGNGIRTARHSACTNWSALPSVQWRAASLRACGPGMLRTVREDGTVHLASCVFVLSSCAAYSQKPAPKPSPRKCFSGYQAARREKLHCGKHCTAAAIKAASTKHRSYCGIDRLQRCRFSGSHFSTTLLQSNCERSVLCALNRQHDVYHDVLLIRHRLRFNSSGCTSTVLANINIASNR